MTNEVARTVAENTLLSEREIIQELLPTPDHFAKFRRFVASASMQNDDLNNASYPSITKAFLDCAKTGLMPDGDEAAIVTRYDKKQGCHVAAFQPMVKGVNRIINESSNIKSFHVKAVYNGDSFKMWADENGDHIEYMPDFNVERLDENIKLFYACAVLENGSVIVEVMTKEQVDKHKASAKQAYVWNAWYSEMGVKTIIHRILKRLPIKQPELVTGLESSLDIDLSNPEQESSVIKKPSAKVFKTKELRNQYIAGIVDAINADSKSEVAELYLEMDNEQKQNIWSDFGSNQQKFIRESLDEHREQQEVEVEPT